MSNSQFGSNHNFGKHFIRSNSEICHTLQVLILWICKNWCHIQIKYHLVILCISSYSALAQNLYLVALCIVSNNKFGQTLHLVLLTICQTLHLVKLCNISYSTNYEFGAFCILSNTALANKCIMSYAVNVHNIHLLTHYIHKCNTVTLFNWSLSRFKPIPHDIFHSQVPRGGGRLIPPPTP